MARTASFLGIEQKIKVHRLRDAPGLLTVKGEDGEILPEGIAGDTYQCKAYDAYGGTLKASATCTIRDAAACTVDIVFSAASLNDGASGTTVTKWVYMLDRIHGSQKLPLFYGPFEVHPTTAA